MLEVITSQTLSARHGFFTRKGGASSGIFTGLNCGLGSSDQAEIVQINRARAAQFIGISPERLSTVHQIHSAEAVVVGPVWMTDQKADAMVSNQPGACLGILTADCQPVLFYDANAQVIGAAHAGWRGTKDGILEATLAAMEKLGATRTNIVAVIGPTISQTAYEVGPDFKDALCDHDPQAGSYFAQGLADRWLFNLPGYGIRRLQVAGVGRAEWTGHCTFSDPNRFFSYRRSTHAKEVDYGRLISIIRL